MYRILLTLVTYTLLHGNVFAGERILSFHSDIYVNQDGTMKVVESIKVKAERNRIKRGIYRDFPTQYKDQMGNNYRVGFDIRSVARNGYQEDFHTEKRANGLRVYFGHKDRILQPGIYIYTFTYNTSRQLGYFENHDELYWNVTGHDWVFPIDQASATVYLPGGIPGHKVRAEAYTGIWGSREQAYTASEYLDNTITINSSRSLLQHEGLTIVVQWPKGFVHEPTGKEKLSYLFKDNRHLIFACLGILIILGYYLLMWVKVGRDPDHGVVIAHYEPPAGFSPASIRFIEKMGYDKTCFAAAIINLAVKGYLRITETDDEYTLIKTGTEVAMAPGESALVKKLFAGSKSRILKQSDHSYIKNALDAHEASLERNYEKIYFLSNTGYFISGVLLTVIFLLLTVLMLPGTADSMGALFMTVWLSIWSIAVVALCVNAYRAWCHVHGIVTFLGAVYASIFAAVFGFFEVMAIYIFAQITTWSMVVVIIAFVAVNCLFYELLKSPTKAGRKLLDRIDGFRRYIDIAEKHELDFKHPKGRCPELFEMYLPYALAMGIEQQWGEQFVDILVKASSSGQAAYSPSWYHGAHWDNYHIGDFSSSLGSSFTRAISSSSTAPGSRSGGGGGGFSGGGGGGGGGGGW